MLSADEYRKKALEADLLSLRATDAALRAAYEELSHSWRQLANQVEWIDRGRKGNPPNETAC